MPAHDAARRRLSLAVQAEDAGWTHGAGAPTRLRRAARRVPRPARLGGGRRRRAAAARPRPGRPDGAALGQRRRRPAARLRARGARRRAAASASCAARSAAAPADDARSEPLVDARRVLRRAVAVERRDGAPLRVLLTSVPLHDDAARRAGSSASCASPTPSASPTSCGPRTSASGPWPTARRSPSSAPRPACGSPTSTTGPASCSAHRPPALEGMGWLAARAPRGPAGRHLGDDPCARGGGAGAAPAGAAQRRRAALGARPHRPGARRPAATPASSARSRTSPSARPSRPRWPTRRSRDALTGLLNRRRLLELLDERPRPQPHRGRRAARAAVPRPRRLQAGQRRARPPGRRRAARRGVAPAARGGARGRRRVALRRRRVRGRCAAACTTRPTPATSRGGVLEAVTGPRRCSARRPCTVSRQPRRGASPAPSHVEAEDVLRDADVAMYQAKAAGKDRWALFDEQARARARERVELAHDLRRAVEQDASRCTTSRSSGSRAPGERPGLASVEALARWSTTSGTARCRRPSSSSWPRRTAWSRSSACRCCAGRARRWWRGGRARRRRRRGRCR